jgi:hypothetical protein
MSDSAERARKAPFYESICQSHEAAGRTAAYLDTWTPRGVANIIAGYLRTDNRVVKSLLESEPHTIVPINGSGERLQLCIEELTGPGQHQLTLSHCKTVPITETMPTGHCMIDISSLVMTDEELWIAFSSGDALASMVEAEPELYPDEITANVRSSYRPFVRSTVMALIGVVHGLASGDVRRS